MQRIIDITLSILSLILLIPFIFFPIIIILKLTGEREIFYIQDRVGIDGQNFGLLKFATMIKNSPNIGSGEITVKDDPRVLPFGKFLRKTKLNELPQLLNIIKGDMSIVGPRPMVPKTYSKYSKLTQTKLNTVRPGLTGIGSIIFRDEERYLQDSENPIDFYDEHIIPYKSDLEVWFVDNYSFYLYIKIILITAWVVLFSKSHKAHRFLGNLPIKPVIFNK